jgi:hypothetical protein
MSLCVASQRVFVVVVVVYFVIDSVRKFWIHPRMYSSKFSRWRTEVVVYCVVVLRYHLTIYGSTTQKIRSSDSLEIKLQEKDLTGSIQNKRRFTFLYCVFCFPAR